MQEPVTEFSQLGSTPIDADGALRFRAAVFDCDGLLVDTGALWWEAFEASAGGSLEGLDPASLQGASVSLAARLLGEHLGREVSELSLGETLSRLVGTQPLLPMPGAARLLAALAGRMPVAVATNAPAEIAAAALEGSGLRGLLGPIVSAEEVDAPKPAPDVYREACRRLGVAPDEALAFEDSALGAAAASAAGMTVVGVPSGAHDLEADLVVARLDDPRVFRMLSAA